MRHMSDVVNTADAFSRGPNHHGAVLASPDCTPAGAPLLEHLASLSRACLGRQRQHVKVIGGPSPLPLSPAPTTVVELAAMREPAPLLAVAGPRHGVHTTGQDHPGQVVGAAPWTAWGFWGLRGLGSERGGPTRPWSSPSRTQHARSPGAISRTSPVPGPRPSLLLSGASR